MSEPLNPPSYLELRTQLEDMVRKDLLGPAGGPEEIVDEATVRGRYIVGMLAPKGRSTMPDEQDELAVGGETDTQDGKPASPPAQVPAMLPSSFGMTFSIAPEVESFQIIARWGHYERVRTPEVLNEKGEPKLVWKRTPVEGISGPIPLKAGKLAPWFPDLHLSLVYVTGLIRKYPEAWTITLFLINAQTEPKTLKDEAWLFQPELIVRSPDANPIFIKRPLTVKNRSSEDESRIMAMLYRRQVEFAVGHGVGVHIELPLEGWERAVEVCTTAMPTYEVAQVDVPGPHENPDLKDAGLDMKTLGELEDHRFSPALEPLANAYQSWIEEQEQRLVDPPDDLEPFIQAGMDDLQACRQTLRRIRNGIELLSRNHQAAEAFRFANQAMALQRIHSILSREIRQGAQVKLEDLDIPENRSWRPFQLAFILLNLPGLVDPAHPDRSHPTQAKADLLWFPTGGGKTEAYLGVAAFAMAIRRLQGELGGRSGQAGVTVLMRYTLRLLTLQQFQRATALMCACEILRRQDEAHWGAEPFRIGLWVGQRSTPNWTKDAAEAIRENLGVFQGKPVGGKGTPLQLTNCPWCGRPISANNIRVETVEAGRGRTFQYCSDPLGNCEFSFKKSPDEGLPIVVVDEEIYRRLPALLIATVDKFAQLPWKGETQMLFGHVNGWCPRHGYRSPEINDSDSHPAVRGQAARFPAVRTQPCVPLRPPDLIIQDELHLISGPLGTLVGLYETAVDRLASWDNDGVRIRPKVIASTATIRRAHNQVNSLFLREVSIFPPSGIDAGDNFFSIQRPRDENHPGRLYLGVCSPGTRMKTILIRVYVAYMAAAQKLYEDYGRLVDPWMTLIGYFNSMRELGGMRRVVDDAVRTRLRTMDERGLAKRFIEPLSNEELTSRKSATDIPRILDRLEAVFDPQEAARRKTRQAQEERLDYSKIPYDVVLATNMISVGVDVSRLSLMVVASQPKATAEYIQATSRVGRAFPGLVCTVYNWARPRDLSHYERFEHYHATFYQQVEALSVTPFSPRALDRGLSAVLVSYLQLLSDEFNPNEKAGKVTWSHALFAEAEEEIGRRAGLVRASVDIEDQVKQMVRARRDEWLNRASAITGGAILTYSPRRTGLARPLLKQPTAEDWTLFTCLNSLRDVEPEINLVLDDHGMDYEPENPPSIEASEETEPRF